MYARKLFIFTIVLISIASIASTAFAKDLDPDLNAHFAPGADGQNVILSTSIRLPQAHSGSSVTGSGKSPYMVSPFYWTSKPSIYARDDRGIGTILYTNMACNPETFVGDGNGWASGDERIGDGVIYQGSKVNRSTGAVVSNTIYCKAPSVTRSTPPRGVTLPPSYGDMWNSIYTQAFDDSAKSSGVYVAPTSPGLVQLPTNIWAEFENGQSISRNIAFSGGYRLEAIAYISRIEVIVIDSNGNSKTISSITPDSSGIINGGSYNNPIATYTFKQKGQYSITTGIVWSVRGVTLSGPDIGSLSVPLGSLRLEVNRNYIVNELRPGLTK